MSRDIYGTSQIPIPKLKMNRIHWKLTVYFVWCLHQRFIEHSFTEKLVTRSSCWDMLQIPILPQIKEDISIFVFQQGGGTDRLSYRDSPFPKHEANLHVDRSQSTGCLDIAHLVTKNTWYDSMRFLSLRVCKK